MQTAVDEPETWKDLVSCLICEKASNCLTGVGKTWFQQGAWIFQKEWDLIRHVYTYDDSLNFHNSTPSQSEFSQCTPLFARDLANFLCGMRSTVKFHFSFASASKRSRSSGSRRSTHK